MLNPTESTSGRVQKPRRPRAQAAMETVDRKRVLLDGPFTETKELWVGDRPARDVGAYATVNGLRMYHEVHGRGRPVVLLHAALSNIESGFGKIVRALSTTRKVIAIEQQAHGRTADIDRLLTYEQMADDAAELLRKLDIRQADFFGFSMGAAVALVVAARHPGVVHKLAVVAASSHPDGYDQELLGMLFRVTPESDFPPEIKAAFLRGGTSPDQWPAAVKRIHQSFTTYRGLRREQLASIRAPTLVIGGEYGVVNLDHTRELARLVPKSRLEVFTGDDHDPRIVERAAALVPGFLDA